MKKKPGASLQLLSRQSFIRRSYDSIDLAPINFSSAFFNQEIRKARSKRASTRIIGSRYRREREFQQEQGESDLVTEPAACSQVVVLLPANFSSPSVHRFNSHLSSLAPSLPAALLFRRHRHAAALLLRRHRHAAALLLRRHRDVAALHLI